MRRILPFATAQLRRLERPLADVLFLVLLLAVLIAGGWLVARHDRYWDWTAVGTNSLAPESLAILGRLDGPLRATVFADPASPLGKGIERLLMRYRQAQPGMLIEVVDPQLFPERTRDADVTLIGQILLDYRGRRETLAEVSERAISAAIARLGASRVPWVAVIEGHGERAIQGEAGADLGRLGRELSERGFLARPLDLGRVEEVPINTRILVLSTPRIPLFPGVVERLIRYLDRGGNLLWLMDPGALNGLEPLADTLGLRILPGTVVDADAAALGVAIPAVAVIAEYPDHPFSVDLDVPALLPGSIAFGTELAPGWLLDTYLATGARSWNEVGRLDGPIDRDEVIGEQAGPLPVVLAMSRPVPEDGREQRVLVVGDGDFASNAQIGAYGNRALALALLAWLSDPGDLTVLPPDPREPAALILDEQQRLRIGLGSLVIFPGLFLLIGLGIRWLRWRGT
ncbi:GldG family protein [Thiocapsa rosea]|uniref:ABC transporter family protein n=1 Tax=Thiocapsa rosea TaxID=69360 RepID=A0A495V6S0_9GAMM|nr:GldG family protein [Thiocapsa rosea]RKT44313.1 ABC transporter family protein [Thiocapsa rosea]